MTEQMDKLRNELIDTLMEKIDMDEMSTRDLTQLMIALELNRLNTALFDGADGRHDGELHVLVDEIVRISDFLYNQ